MPRKVTSKPRAASPRRRAREALERLAHRLTPEGEALDYIANYILPVQTIQVSPRGSDEFVKASVAEHLRAVARQALAGKGHEDERVRDN